MPRCFGQSNSLFVPVASALSKEARDSGLGMYTHHELLARAANALAIPSVLVGHFQHMPVHGDECIKVVDDGV